MEHSDERGVQISFYRPKSLQIPVYRLKFFFNLKTLSPNFVLIQGPPNTKRIKCKHFSYSSGKCLRQLISRGNDQLKSQGTLVLRTFTRFTLIQVVPCNCGIL